MKLGEKGDIKFIKKFDKEGQCFITLLTENNKKGLFSKINLKEDNTVNKISFYSIDSKGNIKDIFQINDSIFSGYGSPRIFSTKDGFFVCEQLQEHLYSGFQIIHFDNLGNYRWAKNYQCDLDSGKCMSTNGMTILSSDNGFIIATNIHTDRMSTNIILKKVDLLGNEIWSEEYGGYSTESIKSIQPLESGGFIISAVSCSFGDACEGSFWVFTTDSKGKNPNYKEKLDQVVLYVSENSIYVDRAEHLLNYRGIELIKPNGEVILKSTYKSINELFISDLPKGIYFVKVLSDVEIPLYKYEKIFF